MKERLFLISRTVDLGSHEFKSVSVTVLGQNMYNAYGRFSDTANFPNYSACDEIGESDNPCLRYILPDGTRYYIKPMRNT